MSGGSPYVPAVRRRVATGALLPVVVFSLVAFASVFGTGSGASSVPGGLYRDGVVLVRFAGATSASDRLAAQAQVGGLGMRRIARKLVALRVPSGRVETVVKKLEARGDVVYAEPDYLHTESAVPNDPSFGLQWALRNTGQSINGKTGVAGADEHVTAAWSLTTGTPSVVVAEADSGVDYTHPDLAANIWSNPGGLGGCAAGTHGFNVLAGTCDPMDDETVYGGHGTHVAGIIGATGNNATGVAGVNWTTSILPVKWLDSAGFGSTSDLISALDWVVKAKQAGVNIRVVNDSATFVGTAPSQALSDEIDLLGQNDILFVTAAGNTGDDNDDPAKRRYPCGYARPTEVCVTASDQTDHLPAWANHGADTVDLAAPGDNVYSTLRNGTYGYVSGGSMASAQVAGVAALVLSRASMSAVDLRADILNGVDVLVALDRLVRTSGRLDACKALPGCTEVVTPVAPKTLGTRTVGTRRDPLSANRKRVNRYQLSTPGALTKLSVYLQSSAVAGKQALRGVIYSDTRGVPKALLGVTSTISFRGGEAAGWYDLSLAKPLALQPGFYWIGVLSGSTSKIATIRWKSVASSGKYNSNRYAAGPSNPFGPVTTDSERLSLYATYTPVAPPSLPSRSASVQVTGTSR